MDSRLFGFFAIAFIMVLMYQAWMEDYGPKPELTSQSQSQFDSSSDIPSPPDTNKTLLQNEEDIPDIQQDVLVEQPKVNHEQEQIVVTPTINTVRVETDLLKIEIDLQGGNIAIADLQAYPQDLKTPEEKIRIFDSSRKRYYIAQSGLQTSLNVAPNHYAVYQSALGHYRLGNSDSLIVPLTWSQDNINVTKRFIFQRGSYVVRIEHEIENNSSQPWTGRQYRQLQRFYEEGEGRGVIYTYTGGVIYNNEDKYEKISFDDMEDEPLNKKFDNGWAAIIQHYFLSAWIPLAEEENHYYTKVHTKQGQKRYVLGLSSPMKQIVSGESGLFTTRLFVGPKVQDEMKKVAEGLELTVDYGWLTPVSQPLFWLLNFIQKYVGNWGFSIILVTLLIKLVFYKLSETSYRSMAKMRKVTPKLQSIRERYSDDRQRQSMAMMELYKKEKINPMGSCFPMLIQIPVFIALYWVLLESVELRQAPFMLWINDLSAKDPFFILPVLMGITMYIQQKLNPAPVDPIQAKVFMMLPYIFTVFFAFFPSGLVLYWVANNTLTIAQQWYITNKVLANNG